MTGFNYLWALEITHAFLIALSIYMLFKITPDLAKKPEFRSFQLLIVIFMVYQILKSIWILQEAHVIALPNGLHAGLSLAILMLLSLNVFSMYLYGLFHFDSSALNHKVALRFGLIPLMILVALFVLSLFNGFIFSITEDGNITLGSGRWIIYLMIALYFIAIIVFGFLKASETRTSADRHEAIIVTVGLILLFGFMLTDVGLGIVSIIPMAIFAVDFILFSNLLSSKIYSDALTGLNNRRKAEEYFNAQQDTINEEVPMYLLTGDINNFKGINDTYGHQEGDEALLIAAKAIMEVAIRYNGMASRFGGDEFTVAFRRSKEIRTDVEEIVKELNQSLRNVCKEKQKPYELSISVGYAVCTDPTISVDEYIREADEMLYREKRLFHAKGV